MKVTNPFYAPEIAAAAVLVEGLHGRASVAQVRAASAVLDRAFDEADRALEVRVAKLEESLGIGRGEGSLDRRLTRLDGAFAFACARKLGPVARDRRSTKAATAKPKRRGARAR